MHQHQQPYDPTAVPHQWMDCPNISTIIANRLIVFKTPLDDRYRQRIPTDRRWTCPMLIDAVQRSQTTLGLVVDLTTTSRFYREDIEFRPKNIGYEKIRCRGHHETPNDAQIDTFVRICQDFISNHPTGVIGVHCVHGFNLSGYFICAYLCRQLDYSIEQAIKTFAQAREPGIYNQDFLNSLQEKFGRQASRTIRAPRRPQWCFNTETTPNHPHDNQRQNNSAVRFAIDLPQVNVMRDRSRREEIQRTCQQLTGWNRRGFPGSQPGPLDLTNYQTIFQSPYMVSWKADGTRYLMHIEDENRIYMIDRNNYVFQVNSLRFPKDRTCSTHLTNTLVDGEFVLDNDHGVQRPRYLIYDIISYHGQPVGDRPFPERLRLCQDIVTARNQAIGTGLIDKRHEPFSVRNKDFWPLLKVPHLLSDKFRSQVTHGMDGLIFQPERDPYHPGPSPLVFKWKDDQTIDFQLKIQRDRSGYRADLYVNHQSDPYTSMPYSPDLDQYNDQVIECSYREQQWHFYRARPDKAYPNAKLTVDNLMQTIENQITGAMLCAFVEEHIGYTNY